MHAGRLPFAIHELALAAALGFLAVVLPVVLDPDVRRYDAAFLPFVRTAVEGLKPACMAWLVAAGALAGLLTHRTPFAVLGASTMLPFPVWSAVDMAADTARGGDGGHSLWPIEWGIYGALSLFGVLGAGGARLLRRAAARGRLEPDR